MKKTPEKKPKMIITAGPTIERLDPVRYLSNFSTGQMGYALAEECGKRGFEVCLISGPVALSAPEKARVVRVSTAREMREAIEREKHDAGCLIMAAAVCDFRPVTVAGEKIKKDANLFSLSLEKNPDILREMGKPEGLVKVGFALETQDPEQNGRKKLMDKGLDIIVVNEKNAGKDPFGDGKKHFMLIRERGDMTEFQGIEKKEMAKVIVDEIEQYFRYRPGTAPGPCPKDQKTI